MKRLQVTNSSLKKWIKEFETQQELDDFLEFHTQKQTWGKKAGWYSASSLTQAEINSATASSGTGGVDLSYQIPNQFTSLVEDITAEVAERDFRNRKLNRVTFGKQLVFEFTVSNDAISEADTLSLFGNADVKSVKDLLELGLLDSAKNVLQSMSPITDLLTQQQIDDIILAIDNYVANE